MFNIEQDRYSIMNTGAEGVNGLGPVQDLRRGGRDPSFAAAARQLRSSHPTVGRKIALLEDQLGITLFARSNEGLSLTSQGRKFREHVDAMALAAVTREAAVSATGAQARGVVKLSIGATFASHWLMPQAWAISARARPYPTGDHHPSVSGQRAPPRGGCGAASGRCR
jgi:DNA-binding transcriptional LysR family regulator